MHEIIDKLVENCSYVMTPVGTTPCNVIAPVEKF
jgi:hypothetical protein